MKSRVDAWLLGALVSMARDGSVVQSLERTAGYTLNQPNGACGPTCERLTVTLGPLF